MMATLGDIFRSAKEWRAKIRAALRQTLGASQVVVQAWAKPWVVDCRSVGNGASALNTLHVVRSAWTSFCFPKMIDFSDTLF
jgi:hypothetical protein